MSPADLHDVLPLVGLRRDRIARALTAGISRSFTFTAAAMFIAVGKESLEDCDMLTWPLG
jgi:hypothetical protein